MERDARRWISLAAVALVAAVSVTACGSGSSSSDSGKVAAKSVSADPPSSGCGSYKSPAVKDPDGLVAALPAKLKAAYEGYPYPVQESVWADWKPKHDPPYKVAVSWAQIINDFQVNITEALKSTLNKNPDIGEVDFKSTGTTLDVTQQLQQIQTLLNGDPDLLILEELQPNAYVRIVDEAGKRGIPVIVVVDSIPSKYAVNVNFNQFREPARTASVAVRQIAGQGNVVYNRGIPGVGTDTIGVQGFDAVLKQCPDIKKLGDIYANFVDATAKSEGLKFLATHTQPIAGVLSVAGGAQGVISAFEQTGRPVPTVADTGASKRSLAYWRDNFEKYRGAADVVPEVSIGLRVGDIAGRMLAGDGAKYSQIVGSLSLVTDSNLDEFVEPDWTFKTPGDPLGPRDGFLSPADLDAFFESSTGSQR